MQRFNPRLIFAVILFCFVSDLCPQTINKEIRIPNQGKIAGVEMSKQRIQKITAYYGIPYAQPPLNYLRFAPPVTNPLPKWEGVRSNTDYLASCMQDVNYRDSDRSLLQLITSFNFTVGEDCLFLNVFVPYGDRPSQGFATIIWFHPGQFSNGSPSMWNPHTLVYRQRVIVVTVGWRLNIFGFFTTVDGEAKGNYGIMDQQAAMQWVKNHIALFGGNTDNISIMGYGAGAFSVALHMVLPGSRGLFTKAIAMSGNYFSPTAIRTPNFYKELVDDLAEKFGCERHPSTKLLECLRRADEQLLVQQSMTTDWGPILDVDLSNETSSAFLQDLPMNYFQRGEFHKVPLLIGYTNMETAPDIESLRNVSSTSTEYLQSVLTEILSADVVSLNSTKPSCATTYDFVIDAVMFFYGPSTPLKGADQFRNITASFVMDKNYASPAFRLASFMSKDLPVYMYRFDIKPSTSSVTSEIPEWVNGVPHLFDLIYVWGIPYWRPELGWDRRDKRISDTVMSFWTNFAKSSNPTETSIEPVIWSQFKEDDPRLLVFGGTFNMSNSTNLDHRSIKFWNEYYPKLTKMVFKCEETEEGGSGRIVNIWGITLIQVLFLGLLSL